jgi:hypothetical protein
MGGSAGVVCEVSVPPLGMRVAEGKICGTFLRGLEPF